MKTILVCWLGETDVQVLQGSDDIGPIAKAVKALPYDEVHIISDLKPDNNSRYENWLRDYTDGKIEIHSANYSGPATVENVTAATVEVVDKIKELCREETLLTFHLSSGEPIMGKVLSDLAETRYFPTASIELSKGEGVERVIHNLKWSDSKLLPSIMQLADQTLERLMAGLPAEAPEFSDICAKSPSMQKAVAMARRLAPRSVTVLIEGESGTGKELFARAIHKASLRGKRDFIVVNCGAIPADIIESELFGYVRGAFTGATKDHAGYFGAADGGTLFLDEIGELSAQGQVKLLRVLENHKVMPVGSREEIDVDVRIIAATNRNVREDVAAGKFRLDLFYRLAIGIIRLPPLRERQEDIDLLIEKLLETVNREINLEPGYQGKGKKLSLDAKNLLLKYSWPGNARELLNTMIRAAIRSPGEVIEDQDIENSMLGVTPANDNALTQHAEDGILGRPLANGFSLPELRAKVMRHYLRRALKDAHGNKTLAAHLVGLSSRQTFNSWMKQCDIED